MSYDVCIVHYSMNRVRFIPFPFMKMMECLSLIIGFNELERYFWKNYDQLWKRKTHTFPLGPFFSLLKEWRRQEWPCSRTVSYTDWAHWDERLLICRFRNTACCTSSAPCKINPHSSRRPEGETTAAAAAASVTRSQAGPTVRLQFCKAMICSVQRVFAQLHTYTNKTTTTNAVICLQKKLNSFQSCKFCPRKSKKQRWNKFLLEFPLLAVHCSEHPPPLASLPPAAHRALLCVIAVLHIALGAASSGGGQMCAAGWCQNVSPRLKHPLTPKSANGPS